MSALARARLFWTLNDDGVCDRLPDSAIPATQALVAANDHSTVKPTCPLELVNDPYPGDCNLYIDADGNGICDLSEPELVASGAVAPPPRTPEPTPPGITLAPRPQTVCPLGLVNDPYPGECKWYVDANGNGICDLSEPELVASGAVTPPVNGTTASSSSTQQRRRGRNN